MSDSAPATPRKSPRQAKVVDSGEVVAIRSIAAGGDGIGNLADGRTVFVPRTAPGDVVRLDNIRVHRRFARARAAELISAGPGRTAVPCPHYVVDRCGGCQLMHLDLSTQRAVKSRIIGDALRRLGGIEIADPEVVAAPAALGYRTKVTLTMQDGVIGYHRQGQAGEVFEVRRCLLMDQKLEALHQQLRGARDLLPGDTEQVVLRLDGRAGRHLVVRTSGDGAWTSAEEFAARMPSGTTVWWHPKGGAPRAMAGSESAWPATVFEQVNPPVAAEIRGRALRQLTQGLGSGAVVWDLYAGIGESTALLAGQGYRVSSVEIDRRAVALAEERGPAGPDRRAGDVAEVVGRLPAPEAILSNPPRTGMSPEVVAAIARSGARRLVYISCDPATMSRDIRCMGDGWRVVSVTGFDQFPETAHIEVVAVLEANDE